MSEIYFCPPSVYCSAPVQAQELKSGSGSGVVFGLGGGAEGFLRGCGCGCGCGVWG